MATCVAKQAGKLIDARFLRPLSPREREKMEDHLAACGACRERYRKLQLADRVIAFGEGEHDRPAPVEADRIAHDLGLFDAPRNPWFTMRFFGAAASVAALALIAVLFIQPSEELTERGGMTSRMTFSAYAISKAPRLLENGATVSAREHLKLRASWGDVQSLEAVEVLLVAADGRVVHVQLAAPVRSGETVSIPGAISLSAMPRGELTVHVIARGLKDATVERFDLEVSGE